MSSSSISSPEMPPRPDNTPLPSTTRTSNSTSVGKDGCHAESQPIEAVASTAQSTSPLPAGTGCFDALAAVLLVQISSFSPESNLSGVCRSALSAIRHLHYKVKVGIPTSDKYFFGHMGIQESGALATGRVVTRITVCVGNQSVRIFGGGCFGIARSYSSWFKRFFYLHADHRPPARHFCCVSPVLDSSVLVLLRSRLLMSSGRQSSPSLFAPRSDG